MKLLTFITTITYVLHPVIMLVHHNLLLLSVSLGPSAISSTGALIPFYGIMIVSKECAVKEHMSPSNTDILLIAPTRKDIWLSKA